jgi:lipoate-protein ligase B
MNNVVQDRTPSTAAHATPAQFGAGNEIRIRMLGLVDYATALRSMQEFTLQRSQATCDELWLLQHPAVYTLGIAARPQALATARQWHCGHQE